MSRVLRAAIFDLDGTLADTFPLIVSAWNAALADLTGHPFTAEEVIARFGIPDAAMIRRELNDPRYDDAARDRAVETYHHHYESSHASVQPFPGVIDMLDALHQSGIALAVVTGKGRRTCDITLSQLGWTNLFSAIISGQDMPRQKPDPAGPLIAAKILKIPPHQCAFIGDSPADIGAGQSAAMTTIAALWHPTYIEQVTAMSPHYLARTPSEVLRAFNIQT